MFWLKFKYQNISAEAQTISIRKCFCMVPWEVEFQVSQSHFPFCPMIQLISLFSAKSCYVTKVLFPNSWWDLYTIETSGDLRLWNTNKFPHHPTILYGWKYFGF